MIFSGNSHPKLGKEIASYLKVKLGKVSISYFDNGEIYVRFLESVRGADVFVIQTISNPVNQNIMELLIMVDALKRASAERITAVIPYFGYSRQDKKAKSREPISAKLIADLLATAGINRLITMDLHAGQIQGFFNIPVDHLTAVPLLVNYIKGKKFKELVVVSPDVGRVKIAKKCADFLEAGLAILHKSRPKHNVAEVTHVVGEVRGKITLIIDDMIDTGGTVVNGAEALLREGAKEVYVCATHPIFSPPALKRLQNSLIKEVVVTNTIPIDEGKESEKIKVLSVASLFGRAIFYIHKDESVSRLFKGLEHA